MVSSHGGGGWGETNEYLVSKAMNGLLRQESRVHRKEDGFPCVSDLLRALPQCGEPFTKWAMRCIFVTVWLQPGTGRQLPKWTTLRETEKQLSHQLGIHRNSLRFHVATPDGSQALPTPSTSRLHVNDVPEFKNIWIDGEDPSSQLRRICGRVHPLGSTLEELAGRWPLYLSIVPRETFDHARYFPSANVGSGWERMGEEEEGR